MLIGQNVMRKVLAGHFNVSTGHPSTQVRHFGGICIW